MDLASNRRNHERFPFSSRLEVRAHHQPGRVMTAEALDVSVGGFGFRSPLPWTVGDLIAVTLPEIETTGRDPRSRSRRVAVSSQDPAGKHIEIVAVVRHVHIADGEFVIGAERHTD
jgi:hypothetical protein